MSAPWGLSTGTSSSAWATVLGNPSSRKDVFPSSHWWACNSFSTSLAMNSSGRRSPLEMKLFAVVPMALPLAISCLKMSPVDKEWICGSFFKSLEVRVPFPDPGAPMMTILIVFAAADILSPLNAVFSPILCLQTTFLPLSSSLGFVSNSCNRPRGRPFGPREMLSGPPRSSSGPEVGLPASTETSTNRTRGLGIEIGGCQR